MHLSSPDICIFICLSIPPSLAYKFLDRTVFIVIVLASSVVIVVDTVVDKWINGKKCNNLHKIFFYLFYCIYLFIYLFLLFRAAPTAHGVSQGRGSNQSCSCWPTPQPQQCRIPAASATYTIAQSNARSLTH